MLQIYKMIFLLNMYLQNKLIFLILILKSKSSSIDRRELPEFIIYIVIKETCYIQDFYYQFNAIFNNQIIYIKFASH